MLHTFMLSLFQVKVTGAHMKDFGMRLQELRKQRGMTQKMLAERINKSLSVQEFSKPSVCVHAISDEQTKIINKLLCIFFEKT